MDRVIWMAEWVVQVDEPEVSVRVKMADKDGFVVVCDADIGGRESGGAAGVGELADGQERAGDGREQVDGAGGRWESREVEATEVGAGHGVAVRDFYFEAVVAGFDVDAGAVDFEVVAGASGIGNDNGRVRVRVR